MKHAGKDDKRSDVNPNEIKRNLSAIACFRQL